MRMLATLPCMLLALGSLPAAGQLNSFGLDPNQITSFATGTWRPSQYVAPATFKAYSLFNDGTTRFLWYLRNQEDSGTPTMAGEGSISVYGDLDFIRAGATFFGDVNDQSSYFGVIFANNPYQQPPGYQFELWDGLFGCTLPDGLSVSYIQTCDRLGYSGWVQLEVEAAGYLTLNDIEVTMVTDNVTVTPEPISILLLGTGLAGIAGAARRRRRREGSV